MTTTLDRPSCPTAATPEQPIPARATVCHQCWLSCAESPWGCADQTCPCACRGESA